MDENAQAPDRIIASNAHRAFAAEAVAGPAGLWSREILSDAEIAVLPLGAHRLVAPAAGLECRLFLVLITDPRASTGNDPEALLSAGGTGVACRMEGKAWRIVADPIDRLILDRNALNAARALGPLALAQAANAAVRWPDAPTDG